MITRHALSSILGAALLLTAAAPARADIITFDSFGAFSSFSNANGLTQENVLAIGDETGIVVSGFTNQTDTEVLFTSLINTTLSVDDANGQAQVSAANDQPFNGNVRISLVGNTTFTSLAFNLDTAAGATGTIVLTTLEPGGQVTLTNYTLGPGANFFGVAAINGQSIVSETIGGGVALDAIQQVRIGGISTPTAVPDGGATALLLGLGMLGLSAARRRVHKR